ncbi:hypothetical protein TKK_0001932 [Trichogramma kaykai]|uniref:Guanine nucleotide-binding protein-like 1 n=1 Tax=Trichogramma kaykai TaxID=54128 RepID=A0ABD2X8F0_9HYME
MPQARRKTPFSTKAKKQQLQARKQRKTHVLLNSQRKDQDDDENAFTSEFGGPGIKKINKQPCDNTGNKGKYALQFFQESQLELKKRKEQALEPVTVKTIEEQEISDDYFPEGIDMPKRPAWDFSMSKEELDMREQKYFTEYLKSMEDLADVSYFELNLETWRQLWRVIEITDILLIIVDIRYPVMMFPPYLYKYITDDLGKDMILILNKVDLAPAPLVVAWQHYFQIKYPKLHILVFTSFPTYNVRQTDNNEDKKLKSRRRRGKLKMSAEGAQKIMEKCKEIVDGQVDLTSWHNKIQEEMHLEYDMDMEEVDRKENVTVEKKDTGYCVREKYKNGVLSIGCVGTPNVGKSSLINALMGKKVVSVSRTPGHTKHFQTIYLTKNVCLCDCPGLVFPSTVPKPFQILMGSFPIAQVREPYSTIKFIAERIDLPKLLKLHHEDDDFVDGEEIWSAMDICDSWAAKRNFRTAKAARLDSYRAANNLLRMTLEGKICVLAYPPKWSKEQKTWETHPDVEIVQWIQARMRTEEDHYYQEKLDSLSESDEDDAETNEEQETSEKDNSGDSKDESSDEEEIAPKWENKFQLLDEEM